MTAPRQARRGCNVSAAEIHVRKAARCRFGPWVVAMVCLVLSGFTPPTARAEAPRDPVGSAIVDGNLFHPSRSVPTPLPPPQAVPTAAPPAPPPPPPPKFVLSGVVIHGKVAMALLQEPGLTQNRVVLVEKGQPVGSYELTDVQSDRVTLRSPTGALTVPLFNPPTLAAVRAAVAPAAATGTSNPSESAPAPAIRAPRPEPAFQPSRPQPGSRTP